MNLDVREWMLLAGGVLFLLVVIDGVRRVLADRKEEVRLSKNARKGFPPLDNEAKPPKNSELIGEARVVSRTETDDVPVLLTTVDDDDIEAYVDENNEVDALEEETIVEQQFDEPEVVITQGALDLDTTDDEPEPAAEPEITAATDDLDDEPLGDVEQVVVINVHAQLGEELNGKEMLETLLSHDVRFGEMDIFHKREALTNSKRVQFSIVNSVEPGTFPLDEIDSFSTPGVTFFMQLPGPKKPMEAFKVMLASADALTRSSGGRMLDEQRNPISQQTLEHMKQQVEDFERRSLVKPKL